MLDFDLETADTLDLDTTIVEPRNEVNGWLRWRHHGVRRLKTHCHEDIYVWWIDHNRKLHRSHLETSATPHGRVIEVTRFGTRADEETEREMCDLLLLELDRWDHGEVEQWHRGRRSDSLDLAIEDFESGHGAFVEAFVEVGSDVDLDLETRPTKRWTSAPVVGG